VLGSKGLRLSAYGGVVFLIGVLALLVLPDGIAVAGMLVGGLGVFGGFAWTLFSYYVQPPQ
jgi:hypothetical protein